MKQGASGGLQCTLEEVLLTLAAAVADLANRCPRCGRPIQFRGSFSTGAWHEQPRRSMGLCVCDEPKGEGE